MKQAILFFAAIALTSAQFPQFPTAFEEQKTKWNGPIADHVNGQLVHDTAEVAAAKSQHARAHSQILSILPELPPEIRYQKTGVINPIVPQNPHNPNPFVPTHHPNAFPQEKQAIHTSPQFRQFAEEIPRSSIGEVPEVHAARVAHLAAFQKAKSSLPPLKDTNQYQNNVNSFPVQNTFGQTIQDTPEVQAARAAHSAAFAAANNFGK